MNIPWLRHADRIHGQRSTPATVESPLDEGAGSGRSQQLADDPLSLRERIDLVRWHIDRYDRLRASTSSRAAVVLSAGAILSAGNAVILSLLLQQEGGHLRLVAVCSVGLTASAALVVLAIIRATGVLVSLRPARDLFPDPDLPVGLAFNATDTVRHAPTFRRFCESLGSQGLADILEAAHVELWICVRQHRYRYARLRGAVSALRHAATIFLAVLTVLVVSNLILRVV
jgi:hypothetical protein